MTGRFSRLFGWRPDASRSGRRLLALLAEYPPDTPPHTGLTSDLGDAQCTDNLQHLIDTRVQRLQALTELLAAFDLDITAATQPTQDPRPTFQLIDRWIRTSFPLPPEPKPPRQQFLQSDRSGSDILFSLIADLGLVEGEAIVRRRDDFSWALDLDPENHDMLSYRRPCVVRPPGDDWASTVFDTQITALETAWQIGEAGAAVFPFGESAIEAIAGGHDPV